MKITKKQIVGAAIALLAMLPSFFLPVMKFASESVKLFEIEEPPLFVFTWVAFPVLCIVANLFDKLRGLAAWLMLVPFLYGLTYFGLFAKDSGLSDYFSFGIGFWIYGILTAVLIVYTIITNKRKANKEYGRTTID